MKAKIRIDDRFGCNFFLKRKTARIIKLLFENEDIVKNSTLKDFSVETIAFDIVLCNNAKIQAVNKEFRKINAPTDVITFALFADDENKFIFNKTANLGEIIISVERAATQAENGLEQEILTLICHGILHLLGFDHQNNKDYNFIVKIQKSVISRL